jgi:hypothetical protein
MLKQSTENAILPATKSRSMKLHINGVVLCVHVNLLTYLLTHSMVQEIYLKS